MLQQYMVRKFLKTLENIEYGTLILVTPEGTTHHFSGSDDITVTAHIHDWHLITRILAKGDIGFAESYRDGLFETDNLADLCIIALKNASILDSYVYGNILSHIASQIMYYLRANTLKGSKRNIGAHYDLGNDFYSLWLDPTMTYSSAIFNNDTESLTQAQHNKYDRIITRLDRPNGEMLEIGCGWGGFAERAAHTQQSAHIKAITLSKEQHQFAQQRLNDKATIALEDYRIQTGTYDSIVSIEMLEAVGEKFWSLYFKKIHALLKSKGKAMIQTITIDHQYFKRYRKTGDMIRTFVFPGGMLPSTERLTQEVSNAQLAITDVMAFGHDYARTLACWLNAFDANLPTIKTMGFDDTFIRLWRFYLSVCIASFTVKRTNVIQMELRHA